MSDYLARARARTGYGRTDEWLSNGYNLIDYIDMRSSLLDLTNHETPKGSNVLENKQINNQENNLILLLL
jgi:hypothetical protein